MFSDTNRKGEGLGAWGVGLFSDDLACDVRDTYRELVAGGKTAEAAKAEVLARHAEDLADPDEGPVVWLALAATAWQLGRLDPEMKARALELIERRVGMDRWIEEGIAAKREAVLQKLALKLSQPQRAPVKLKPKTRFFTDWAIGEVIGFRKSTGSWILLHVVDHHSDNTLGVHPVINILDWEGGAVPATKHEIKNARPIWLPGGGMTPDHTNVCLMLDEKALRRWTFSRLNLHRRPGRLVQRLVSMIPGNRNHLRISYAGPAFLDHYTHKSSH